MSVPDARDSSSIASRTAKAQGAAKGDVKLSSICFIHQVNRNRSPADVFAQLAVAFELVRQSTERRAAARGTHQESETIPIIGFDLVGPEHHLIAGRDYDMHMKMIEFFTQKQQYSSVNFALHAGELAPAITAYENLYNHVQQAVKAGAKRIGHGVSVLFEDNSDQLLQRLAGKENLREAGLHESVAQSQAPPEPIAVAVNLSSNRIILGVRGDDHPIRVFLDEGVPVTLSTDNPGLNRADLTHEYMRAHKEHELSYEQMRKISFNGIEHSLLPKPDRDELRDELAKRFCVFERWWHERMQH